MKDLHEQFPPVEGRSGRHIVVYRDFVITASYFFCSPTQCACISIENIRTHRLTLRITDKWNSEQFTPFVYIRLPLHPGVSFNKTA